MARADLHSTEQIGARPWSSLRPCIPLLALGAYFIVMVALAPLAPIADADDGEQILHMQYFDWAYVGAQPALYTWLARLLALVIHPDIAAVRVTRFLCLFIAYAGVYASARVGGLKRFTAIAATFSLFLLTQIGFENTWRFSHILAAIAAFAWIPAALLTALRRQSWAAWGIVGALTAASLLGKYNTIIPFAALVISAATIPALRARMATMTVMAGLVVFALLVAAPAAWLVVYAMPDAGNILQQKILAEPSALLSRAIGLARFVFAIAYSVYPWLAVGALAFLAVALRRKQMPRLTGEASQFETLCWRSLAIMAVVSLVLIVASGSTRIEAHWFQPCILILVLATAATLERLSDGRWVLRLLGVAGGVAAIINVATVTMAVSTTTNRNGTIRVGEMADLVAALKEPIGGASSIVTNWMPLSGNLQMELPDKQVLMPMMTRAPDLMGDRVLLMWTTSDEMPRSLVNFASRNGLDLSSPHIKVWVPAVNMTDGLRSYSAVATTRTKRACQDATSLPDQPGCPDR